MCCCRLPSSSARSLASASATRSPPRNGRGCGWAACRRSAIGYRIASSARSTAGTVNLSGRVSRLQTTGSGQGGLLPTHATDFRPDLEFLGPGSSLLGGSEVTAAKVEEVIDLIVGREEALRLTG